MASFVRLPPMSDTQLAHAAHAVCANHVILLRGGQGDLDIVLVRPPWRARGIFTDARNTLLTMACATCVVISWFAACRASCPTCALVISCWVVWRVGDLVSQMPS